MDGEVWAPQKWSGVQTNCTLHLHIFHQLTQENQGNKLSEKLPMFFDTVKVYTEKKCTIIAKSWPLSDH